MNGLRFQAEQIDDTSWTWQDTEQSRKVILENRRGDLLKSKQINEQTDRSERKSQGVGGLRDWLGEPVL